MNWKYGIHERPNSNACFNACVYATREEAEAAGRELLSRWLSPSHYSLHETSDPVNYRFNFETKRPESIS